MVQMGEEYFHAKDYGKALILLNKVMWDYRGERWFPLLTSILETSLKCAYLTAKIQEYVSNSMELIGKYAQCNQDAKVRIQMNLIRVMTNDVPEPEPGLDQGCVEKAAALWAQIKNQATTFTVEMHGLLPFIETKACFVSETVTADSEMSVEVCLRVGCPFPVRLSKLMVMFNNAKYNAHCVLIDRRGITAASGQEVDSGDLYLKPQEAKVFKFSFLPLSEDVGKQIEISSLALEMGTEDQCCAVLRWTGAGGDHTTLMALGPSRPVIQPTPGGGPVDWALFVVNPLVKVLPRPAQVRVTPSHEPPCLLGEMYLIQVEVENREEGSIHAVKLSLGLQASEENQDQNTQISSSIAELEENKGSNLCLLEIGTMEKGETIKRDFFIKCLQAGNRSLISSVNYNVDVLIDSREVCCACQADTPVSLPTVRPFDVSIKLESLKYDTIEAVHSDDPFLLTSDIRCSSPWAIHIKDSAVQLSEYISTPCEEDSHQSQVADIQLHKSECGAETVCLVATSCVLPTQVNLGTYTLEWRRQPTGSGTALPYVQTSFPLPTVNIEHIPITVHVSVPAFGRVKNLLPLCYTIKNRTPYVQEIQVSMESTDSFMFSGNKQSQLRVLPGQVYTIDYNLFPLVAGQVQLPRLHVDMMRCPGTMDDVIHKMLPTHLFIRPNGKLPQSQT